VSAVLVIAGSDSSGGAGLTRDVQTLTHFATAVVCAVTAVTAQSDREVRAVHPLPPESVHEQIAAALATAKIGAVKIGMLATEAVALAVAASLPPRDEVPVVLDPVLRSSSGVALLDAGGRGVLIEQLLPRATLVTPNIEELAVLAAAAPARSEKERAQQGRALLALGPSAVLVKGGHGSGEAAIDLLLRAEWPVHRLSSPRSPYSLRGTGCALSSAIAAGLAAGLDLEEACDRAKQHLVELFQQAHLR
jgi:hydroxymethylpyrimidine/phosphomethylpyrimidine kinase